MVIAQRNFNDGCAATPSKFGEESQVGVAMMSVAPGARNAAAAIRKTSVDPQPTTICSGLVMWANAGDRFTVIVRQSFQESAGIGITAGVFGCFLKGCDRFLRGAVGVFVAVQADWFQMFREGLRGR